MPLQTVQRILEESCVERVSQKALNALVEFLEDLIREIRKEAKSFG